MATGFDAGNLTPWGQRIFHGPSGIGETAEQASAYSGGGDGGGDDGGGTADCAVDYQVVNQWAGGFQADVLVRNTGTAAIDGWTLRWAFADDQTVTQMWNARASQSGAEVSAASETYTAAIAAGGSVRIGFTGTWNGSNSTPTSFTLDGASCTVG
jgi:mannan endo-1,4-beta-mannosidase